MDRRAADEVQVNTLSGEMSDVRLELQIAHVARRPLHSNTSRAVVPLPWLRASPMSLFATADGALGLVTYLDGEGTALLRALEYSLAHCDAIGSKSYAQCVVSYFTISQALFTDTVLRTGGATLVQASMVYWTLPCWKRY